MNSEVRKMKVSLKYRVMQGLPLYVLLLIAVLLHPIFGIYVEYVIYALLLTFGFASVKKPLKTLLQNGISRKTAILSFSVIGASVAIITALLDVFLRFTFKSSYFYCFFGFRYHPSESVLTETLYYAALNIFLVFLGFFIKAVYYKLGKYLVGVLLALTVPLSLALPAILLSYRLEGGAASETAAATSSPYIPISIYFVLSVLLFIGGHLFLRKSDVK